MADNFPVAIANDHPQQILWNSMTMTPFVFTELANTMKYGGGVLYNLVFTERYMWAVTMAWIICGLWKTVYEMNSSSDVNELMMFKISSVLSCQYHLTWF